VDGLGGSGGGAEGVEFVDGKFCEGVMGHLEGKGGAELAPSPDTGALASQGFKFIFFIDL